MLKGLSYRDELELPQGYRRVEGKGSVVGEHHPWRGTNDAAEGRIHCNLHSVVHLQVTARGFGRSVQSPFLYCWTSNLACSLKV